MTAIEDRIGSTFGDNLPWAHLRSIVMYRDLETCQLDLPGCTEFATEVDHIWPRSEGGPNSLDNLQAACSSCNKAKGDSVDWEAATRQQLGWAIAHRKAALTPLQEWLDTITEVAAVLDENEDLYTLGDVFRHESAAVAS